MGPRPMGHGGQFAQIGKGTRQFTDQPTSASGGSHVRHLKRQYEENRWY